MRLVFFIFFAQLLLIGNGYSQTTPTSQQADNSGEDLAKMLPPLQTLIDSALIHSPAMRMADNSILLSEYALKDIQRDWLDRFSLNANARYGSELYFNQSEELINNIYQVNDKRINYSAGAYFTVRLSDIFDRKTPRQRAKINIEQSKIQKEETEQAVKRLVISGYYEILSLYRTFVLQTKLLSSANMMFEQAKIDYSMNKISYDEYIQASESLLRLQNNFELQKNDYNRTFLLMEELVGIKLRK